MATGRRAGSGCCWECGCVWYGFYGAALESNGAFEGKVDELCRELGERAARSGDRTPKYSYMQFLALELKVVASSREFDS